MSDLALVYQLDATPSIDAVVDQESDWVQRASRGDLEAFDAIMLRYETRLLRFLTGLVGDVGVAQELCQDTFLAAYQAMPRLRGELKLSSWLHTIALNRARSHYRKRKLRAFLPLEDELVPDRGPDMGDAIATNEAVQRTLDRLPRQYAQALLLQTAGGLSCREIGEVLHCSEGAVKVRLMRAREAFKKIYEGEDRERCMV